MNKFTLSSQFFEILSLQKIFVRVIEFPFNAYVRVINPFGPTDKFTHHYFELFLKNLSTQILPLTIIVFVLKVISI